jgi:hypothetical protein
MPKAMHEELQKEATKKGLSGKEADAYIYGTMEKERKKHKSKSLFHFFRKRGKPLKTSGAVAAARA